MLCDFGIEGMTMLPWSVAATVVVFLCLVMAVFFSFGITVLIDAQNDKRGMGSVSTTTLDLRKRSVGWQEELARAEADEVSGLRPVKAFAFADLVKSGDAAELDYGIAIGYASSFLEDPVKQVSYVLYTEENITAHDGKANKRQEFLSVLTNGIVAFSDAHSSHTQIKITTPCVLEECYPYVLS